MAGDHSLFASENVRRLLAANGIGDLGGAFHVGEPLDELHEALATKHDFKRIVRFDLRGPAGTTPVYIKRQWRRERWLPRPTDVRHRIAVQCTPIHEWRGLQLLRSIGICAAEPLALFWRGWGFARGAVVIRAVPTTYSLNDLILNGTFQSMPPERRGAMVRAITAVIQKMHRERISWRSMKPKHFYPEETASGNWRIWLIDCEGVYRRATRRDRQREWGTFLSYIDAKTPTLRESFVTAYAA